MVRGARGSYSAIPSIGGSRSRYAWTRRETTIITRRTDIELQFYSSLFRGSTTGREDARRRRRIALFSRPAKGYARNIVRCLFATSYRYRWNKLHTVNNKKRSRPCRIDIVFEVTPIDIIPSDIYSYSRKNASKTTYTVKLVVLRLFRL